MVSEKEFNLDDNVSFRVSLGDLAAGPEWGSGGGREEGEEEIELLGQSPL